MALELVRAVANLTAPLADLGQLDQLFSMIRPLLKGAAHLSMRALLLLLMMLMLLVPQPTRRARA